MNRSVIIRRIPFNCYNSDSDKNVGGYFHIFHIYTTISEIFSEFSSTGGGRYEECSNHSIN